jgi:hypothetical protein
MIIQPDNAGTVRLTQDYGAMAVKIIVSYDGTTHDDDALMLGRMLAGAGADLSLAFARIRPPARGDR